MTGQELLPKLPGDVQAVLDVERELRHHESLGDDVQQRLRRRLEVSVGILALGVGTATVAATTAGTAGTAGAAAATVTKAGLLTKPWVVAAIAFVLGGAAGAGLHAYARKPLPPAPVQVTTVVVERRIEVPAAASATVSLTGAPTGVPSPAEGTPPPIGTASPSPVAATVSPAAQSGAAAAKPGSAGSTTDTALAAERSLLEVARTALSRGDTASALASLDEHVKKFPGGQLTEEREALYVQALARAGRLDEAKARAAKFAKRFPQSMLLPVVEAATE
jgi:hypothetical protein